MICSFLAPYGACARKGIAPGVNPPAVPPPSVASSRKRRLCGGRPLARRAARSCSRPAKPTAALALSAVSHPRSAAPDGRRPALLAWLRPAPVGRPLPIGRRARRAASGERLGLILCGYAAHAASRSGCALALIGLRPLSGKKLRASPSFLHTETIKRHSGFALVLSYKHSGYALVLRYKHSGYALDIKTKVFHAPIIA